MPMRVGTAMQAIKFARTLTNVGSDEDMAFLCAWLDGGDLSAWKEDLAKFIAANVEIVRPDDMTMLPPSNNPVTEDPYMRLRYMIEGALRRPDGTSSKLAMDGPEMKRWAALHGITVVAADG